VGERWDETQENKREIPAEKLLAIILFRVNIVVIITANKKLPSHPNLQKLGNHVQHV
jgi:hypothetical protein